MNIQPDIKLNFKDVLIVPRRSTLTSRSEVKLEKTFYFYHSNRSLTCIPIMSANMTFSGVKLAKVLSSHKLCAALHKYLSIEEIHEACNNNPLVFMSIGMRDEDFNKLKQFIETYNYVPNLIIDVPNAYLQIFVEYCAKVRELAKDAIIIAGNVVTPEMVQELIIHGKVDCVKIGIGPGSHCETRIVTGVSYPQLSASAECSIVAHGLKNGPKKLGLICLDGGFKEIGDLAKGFVSGADFCMTSSLLCGVDESDGEWIDEDSITCYIDNGSITNIKSSKKLKHYGMSSHYAQEKHGTGRKEYRASEGRVSYVNCKGPASLVIQEILGGLRSTGTFIGANEIRDFNKCGSFIRVT